MNRIDRLSIFFRTLRKNLRNPELWGEAMSSTIITTAASTIVQGILVGIIKTIEERRKLR